MNLREALVALAEGKKVRQTWWVPGACIYVKHELLVNAEGHTPMDSPFGFNGKWEVYEEPKRRRYKTLEELIQGMKVMRSASGNFLDGWNEIGSYVGSIEYTWLGKNCPEDEAETFSSKESLERWTVEEDTK